MPMTSSLCLPPITRVVPVAGVALLLLSLAACRSVPVSPDPEGDPIRIGSVHAYPDHRMLVLTGYVNQVRGPVELLACGPGGKVHESVFVLFARPLDLQAALLLLGYKHGDPMPGLGAAPPAGDAVALWVTWEDEHGNPQTRRAEEFLLNVRDDVPLTRETWIFNGSSIEDGLFMAGAEESFIATYWDPWAILNLASELGAYDEWLFVNPDTVPPLHTPVRMFMRPSR